MFCFYSGSNYTWWRGRPTMDGKTALGASSPANPALHMPEPLSTTRAAVSSSHILTSFYFLILLSKVLKLWLRQKRGLSNDKIVGSKYSIYTGCDIFRQIARRGSCFQNTWPYKERKFCDSLTIESWTLMMFRDWAVVTISGLWSFVTAHIL